MTLNPYKDACILVILGCLRQVVSPPSEPFHLVG